MWIDTAALLALDTNRLVAVLNEGLATSEHAEFMRQLASRSQEDSSPKTQETLE